MTREEKLRHIHKCAVEAQTHGPGVLAPKDVAYLVELLCNVLLEHDGDRTTHDQTPKEGK